MKKISLSKRKKLIIGGIGSFAILATIPAAVVACGSTSSSNDSQTTTIADVSQAFSEIQNSYTSTNSTIAKINPNVVDQSNIATVINETGLLPTLSNPTWSYLFTANTSTTSNTTGILNFSVSISTGAYSPIRSATKKVSISGFSKTLLTPLSNNTNDISIFTSWVNSINKQSFPVNAIGQAIAPTVQSLQSLVSTNVTSANVLNLINDLPVINFSGITITASNIIGIKDHPTTLSVELTFSATPGSMAVVPTSGNTATITITGFMTPVAFDQNEVNQVQEAFNTYILNLIIANDSLGIVAGNSTIPSHFVSSTILSFKPTLPDVALLYADMTTGTSAANKLDFAFPQNLVGALNIVVSSNNTPSSNAFVVSMQIEGATVPGITVSIIANSFNPAK